MTPTRSTAARCDRILALIDACLADAAVTGAGAGAADGGVERTTSRRPGRPHLTLVRG